MIGSNVFGQAQQYQTQAADIYKNMGQFQAPTMQAVGQAATPQLADVNMQTYMNPYTQQVIERGEADIARQREQAMNTLGAQATRAGAFGGSRHGIAEGEAYGQYGRMAADMAAQQRQQAYNQAMQAAQYDVTGQRSAAESAAAREQAARLTNVRSQFDALGQQAAGARGLGGLGSTMFGQGMRGIEQQQQAAALAQRQQQAMLDAARAQTLANLGYPGQALQTGTNVLGGLPRAEMTTPGTPGLFDILTGIGSISTGVPM